MTPEEQIAHIKAVNKARAKRFYDANKAKIAAQRKEVRKEVRELRAAAKQPAPEPEPETEQQAAPAARRARVTHKIRQAATGKVLTVVPPTTEENVKAAMAASDYYNAESSKKTDIDQLKLIFRAINNEQLYPWLKKPQEFVAQLHTLRQTQGENKGQPYALSAYGRMLSAVLNIIKIMKLPITGEQDKELFASYRISKLEHQLSQHAKKHVADKKTAVLNYDKITNNVLKTYGAASLTYLLTVLYKHAPLRNDYNNIILVKSKSEAVNPNKNYMILPEHGNAEVYIQKHKTKKNYGTINAEYPDDVTELLRNYVDSKQIQYGKVLFGDLSKILYSITHDASDKNDGGSRMIRRSLASTLYHKYKKGQATAAEIWKQIRLMAHSESVHILDYIYGVK
jgi:hypothetical protein